MLNAEQVKTVEAVHRRIFKIFEYKTDQEKYGTIEHWADPKELRESLAAGKLVGDCDDFALACRALLWEAGIDNRLVMCTVEDGSGHLVCEASGYILDNRSARLETVNSLPYKWVKMSGFKVGDPWTLVEA